MFNKLSNAFSSIFSSMTNKIITKKSISESMYQILECLLDADVPYDVARLFVRSVEDELVGQNVIETVKPAEQFLSIVNTKLTAFLGSTDSIQDIKIPGIIMVVGLQGSGKTTTLGKLARWFLQEKGPLRILVGSVDFYRPAAIDQLKIVASQAGADFYESSQKNPVSAALDIARRYKEGMYDILLLDTAGRMHIDLDLMKELREIKSQVQPTFTLFVLDAMTGQESLQVAKTFDQEISFDGAVLSKMDSDTRGGAAFAFRYVIQKPILFVGEGEKLDDLHPFYPDRVASRILGLGDIKTLVEQADKKIKAAEQKKIENMFESGSFTLQDFADQMDMVSRLGSLSSIMKYIPGAQGLAISQEKLAEGEREMIRFKAIINSMTRKERIEPNVINKTRRQRIAHGAGVGAEDITTLLQRFEQAKQFAKMIKKM